MSNPDNHLNDETSPYLLQHADNPVNWHGWNQHALNTAKQQNKPILLSIGYSACHWCHVMAHESFEDDATARIMNEHFINIKVDREERPDLDKIYQTAHSLLTGRPGGWPLTVFISPHNQMPFFAGTYFPDTHRYNMPSFKEILNLVSNAYTTKQDEIEKQNTSLQEMLDQFSQQTTEHVNLSALPLDIARKQIESEFQPQYGGYSGTPKFPHPAIIERSLRHWFLMSSQNQPDDRILEMALFTLRQMALGGMYDHLGGGFCRYSTDEKWMIPHFEKMLYDNGQLLTLYCQAFLISNNADFKRASTQTADWAINEMQSSEGGYFSAIDADSEGEEGKFYTWTPTQVKELLNDEDYDIFAQCYGLDKEQNFEGNWHLHTYTDTKKLSTKFKKTELETNQLLDRCRKILFNARNKRIAPGRDDKILCSWNALMIRGMLICGRTFNNSSYIDSAKLSLDFIYQTLWHNRRLFATYKDGKAHLNAYLDDYAYLLLALIEALQCKWNNHYFNWSIELADALIDNFEDKNNGGFYFTSHDHEQLIQRNKTFSDDAMPSGNAIATIALQQLGLLLGNTDYLNSAESSLKSSYENLQTQTLTHCTQLHALENHLHPLKIIILRGSSLELESWQKSIQQNYNTNILSFIIPPDEDLPESLDNKRCMDQPCAYICEGTHCLPPITELSELILHINQNM
jgi:uncharacterized protein